MRDPLSHDVAGVLFDLGRTSRANFPAVFPASHVLPPPCPGSTSRRRRAAAHPPLDVLSDRRRAGRYTVCTCAHNSGAAGPGLVLRACDDIIFVYYCVRPVKRVSGNGRYSSRSPRRLRFSVIFVTFKSFIERVRVFRFSNAITIPYVYFIHGPHVQPIYENRELNPPHTCRTVIGFVRVFVSCSFSTVHVVTLSSGARLPRTRRVFSAPTFPSYFILDVRILFYTCRPYDRTANYKRLFDWNNRKKD